MVAVTKFPIKLIMVGFSILNITQVIDIHKLLIKKVPGMIVDAGAVISYQISFKGYFTFHVKIFSSASFDSFMV